MSRTAVARLLALLGCLLAGPAVAAYALDRQITDQARYLDAVAPLSDDPVVRQAIITQVTDAISRKLGPGDRELPPSARRLVNTTVTKFVESDAFRPAWLTINRAAHPELIAMLAGNPHRLRIDGDTVLLDLGVIANDIKARLIAEDVPLADRLPDITASIPLVSRPAIRRAIPAYDTLQALHLALPLAVAALLTAAVLISPRRTRTVFVAGAGTALAMLLVLLYQRIARGQVTSRSRSPELSGAFYDALTDSLTPLVWVVFAIAAAAALGAAVRWIAAPRAPRAG